MSRFVLNATCCLKVMTNFCSETLPHNLPTLCSVWDLASGECKSTLEGHTKVLTSVAISPDGKTIVSGSLDNTVR